MSGIAEILHNQDYFVSGSDLEDTDVTKRLKNLGVKIFKGHRESNVLKKDLVVISSAISKKNVELKKAISMGIPVIPRAEMLANLMMLKNSIAVAGSHGKTTVTCIMAHIFTEAGLDPTYIIGGKVKSFESNAKLGLGEHIIAEADESDGSFLNLRPLKALVTNIDNDHLGTYGNDFKNLKKSLKYANKIRADYAIILGEEEVKKEVYTVKNLNTGLQNTIKKKFILEFFKNDWKFWDKA